jgi:hypothetical protein
MLILRSNDPEKPVETTMDLAGETFDITLLPLPLKDQIAVFAPFRKRRNVPNPVTGKMELVEYFDDKDDKADEIMNELLCKHLITFSGIAGADGRELDGSKKENKVLLGNVKVKDQEEIEVFEPETKERAVVLRPRIRHFRMLIFDKCNELADTIAEVSEKNLGRPHGGDLEKVMSIT